MPSSLNKGAGRRQRATTRQTGKPTVRRSPCGYRRTVFMPRLDARGPTVAAKGRATTTEAPVRGNRTGAKGAPQCGLTTPIHIYIIVGDGPTAGRRPPRLHDKREWGTPATKRNAGAGTPRLHNRPTAPGGRHAAPSTDEPQGNATPRAHRRSHTKAGPCRQQPLPRAVNASQSSRRWP